MESWRGELVITRGEGKKASVLSSGILTPRLVARRDVQKPFLLLPPSSLPSIPSWGPTGGSVGSVSSGLCSLGSICRLEADSSLDGDNVTDETWVGQWDLSWRRSNSTGQRSLLSTSGSPISWVPTSHSLFPRTLLVLGEPEGARLMWSLPSQSLGCGGDQETR